MSEGSAPPSEAVTFLLTDVEGSSRPWEGRGAEVADAITRHRELLADVVAACGGVRAAEREEGHSVVAAFARAGDAVRAAVEGQRRLGAELPWLPVRMAIHTGDDAPASGAGDPAAGSIARCARLRACGHGGQVLVSSATAALLLDLPAGVTMVDLGAVRLRDLTRAERVWQVVADGLRRQFPPLRSLDAAPHTLPSVVTSFVGRERELSSIAALVREERVVTLTGAGGCGKTRLAMHVAAAVVEDHPGGTWWVDLAPVTAGSDVPDQVAGAVGTHVVPGVDTRAVLLARLRDLGATLLVLDNAEHVIDDVARLVDDVVVACPDAHVLVTSREPLGVAGENVCRVPSLSAPAARDVVTAAALASFESARLFVERARRVRPGLEIDDRAAAAVAAICTRLDGMPLAIELAAARSRTIPLERLAAGLDDAFRLLTGGVRTAMPRQQTLLASIAWSVDLLDEVERAVLRRLAVFQGSFSLEAAEAVVADGEVVDGYVVPDVIGRLVDKSLVQLDDAAERYRLLETVRQFALGRLGDERELAATRDRHAAWIADWSESLDRGEHDFDIGPTHPILPDVFSALEWAYDRAPAQAYRISRGLAGVRTLVGRHADFDRQYSWLAARDGADDPAGWAAAVAGLGHTATTLGRSDFPELAARAEALLDPRDVRSRCWLRLVPGMLDTLLGDGVELGRVLAIAEAERDDHLQRAGAVVLAIMHACSGELDRAERALDPVRRLLARRGLPLRLDTGRGVVGVAVLTATLRGDLAAARTLALSGGRPDASLAVVDACYVGTLAHASGDRELLRLALSWQAGAEAALAAESSARNIAHNMEGPALQVHCCAALLEGRADDALLLLRRRHATTRVLTPALKSFVLQPLAVRLLAAGLDDELAPLVDALAIDVDRLDGPPLPLANLHYIRALVARAGGDLDRAWDQAHAALDVAHGAGLRLVAIDALHLLAELAARRGQTVTSARLFGAVSTERRRVGYTALEVPDPDAVGERARRVCDDEPDACAQGEALAFEDAVAYARRARGSRDRPTVGWSSLTPTEQRVAALAATGATNDEIGAQLLISPTTVKSHLTHIYAKVGVANRTELAARRPRR